MPAQNWNSKKYTNVCHDDDDGGGDDDDDDDVATAVAPLTPRGRESPIEALEDDEDDDLTAVAPLTPRGRESPTSWSALEVKDDAVTIVSPPVTAEAAPRTKARVVKAVASLVLLPCFGLLAIRVTDAAQAASWMSSASPAQPPPPSPMTPPSPPHSPPPPRPQVPPPPPTLSPPLPPLPSPPPPCPPPPSLAEMRVAELSARFHRKPYGDDGWKLLADAGVLVHVLDGYEDQHAVWRAARDSERQRRVPGLSPPA